MAKGANGSGMIWALRIGGIIAARRRFEAIIEFLADACHAGAVAPQIDPAFAQNGQHAQIVNAVQLVGMIMGDQHAVQARDFRIQQLLAHVGRGVDQSNT